ncbi:MAG: error-prone DNA polymerase [Phycisphaerales bacterium]|nr:error-prone DNA polymerase [Phycisphaerales bacterium]
MPDPADAKIHAHPFRRTATGTIGDSPPPARAPYAELTVTSNFTFLTGASHPDELVEQAGRLGYYAIALTDCNSLAGVVRAHVAARDAGIRFVVGCRLRFREPAGLSLFVYPTDRAAYGRLCRLLTVGKRRATKGDCDLTLHDLEGCTDGLLAVAWFALPAQEDTALVIERLARWFDDDRLSLALARLYTPEDPPCREALLQLAERSGLPLAAVNDVQYHHPQRRALHDLLTCVRCGCTLEEAGFRLLSNAERHLKPPEEIARLFADHPQAVARTVEIAKRAAGFSLDQLRYEYPHEICPPGRTPMEHLRELTWRCAQERYADGVPEGVRRQVEHEFGLIEELGYAPYFLTVHDLVRFARSRGILCQGRGAAANSAVCFCLGVTAVDPDRINVLFERFVSRERDEPPDIDIDFEHERREEVIQYIYEKYGRERAGMTAEVITYRSRSAVRDVGKALGLSLDTVDRIARRVHDWHDVGLTAERLTALGLDATDPLLVRLVRLVREVVGFPRHLSQHVGGFVISRGPLCELVPIENAAMPNRTVIEWDKDDIEALGMMKVDVLALGMLTCIRKALELVHRHHGRALTPASIPPEDPAVYDMICAADTVGVFQIESRAQMTMLPRLRPRCFYDLVIEVAIVRPGPIVGDMVHPFLRRRNGEEPVVYPDETIARVLGRTLGVPLFQEQAMALAISAAGFTPGEAEKLRRTISAWKSRSKDAVPHYRRRFIEGMTNNGYERGFAEQCFERLKGFSEYGFPESHSASFALLVYASAWIKCHYPAAFAAALLNSQPMGFYAPAQILRDAAEHGVQVLPLDVNHSDWDCTLERDGGAVRLGFRMVRGLREADAEAVVRIVRARGPIASMADLWRAAGVSSSALHALALADAFGSMGLTRQRALWAVQALRGRPLPLFDALEDEGESSPERRLEPLPEYRLEPSPEGRLEPSPEGRLEPSPEYQLESLPAVPLPAMSAPGEVVRDYRAIGLSLKAHPLSFAREWLAKRRVLTAAQVRDEGCCPHGRWAAVAGIVLFRQRPGTARGVMFMTLEDETARADLIVRPRVYQRFAAAAMYGQVVIARGRVVRNGGVVHLLASRIEELSQDREALPAMSRDFR